MQFNPGHVVQLRKRLENAERKNTTLQLNLDAQRVETKELSKLYFNLKDEYNELKRTNNRLQHDLQNALRRDNDLIVFNKPWMHLINWRSKRKRKVMYRNRLDSSIQQITECIKARVVLTLGSEDIVFQWSEQELAGNREDLQAAGIVLPMNIIPPNNNVHHAIEGAFYNERRDDPFRITHTKKEIRKALFVMDTHCVAHPAYHELHMLSKGFLPPLNLLKQQKDELKTKLDYYVVDGVRIVKIELRCLVSREVNIFQSFVYCFEPYVNNYFLNFRLMPHTDLFVKLYCS